jgi:hypothetical protein
VVFTVISVVAVTHPVPRVGHGGAALVAAAAQELVDLGLQRRLQQQPGTQPGDVLDDRGEVPLAVEQRVDLATDLLCRRYFG